MTDEKVFKVNEFITLKLVGSKTELHVKDRYFSHCMRLALHISEENVKLFDEIDSIDDAADVYEHYLHENKVLLKNDAEDPQNQVHEISPEQEFWGHCSNLQAWAENDYDTRILHSNLAFPLLRELMIAGDKRAGMRFKEEIIKRYKNGNEKMRAFLEAGGFLRCLDNDEEKFLLQEEEREALIKIENRLGIKIAKARRLSDLSNPDHSYSLLYHEEDDHIIGLRLGYLKMRSVPPEIKSLPELRILRLTANKITRIPDFIKDLKSLEILILSQNSLRLLPDPSILKNLKIIHLGYNHINNVPVNIHELNNLELLNLYHNDIKELPEELKKKIKFKIRI